MINLAEYDKIQLMKSHLEKISFLVLKLLVRKPGNYCRMTGFVQALDSTRYYSKYIAHYMLCPEDIVNCLTDIDTNSPWQRYIVHCDNVFTTFHIKSAKSNPPYRQNVTQHYFSSCQGVLIAIYNPLLISHNSIGE